MRSRVVLDLDLKEITFMRSCLWFLLVAALFTATVTAKAGEPAQLVGVNAAMPLILKSVAEYGRHRDCFSCHHQAVPMLAASIARDHGYPVDSDVLEGLVELTRNDLEGAVESYRKGQGQPGGATRAGYALLTLKTAGVPPDELTAAVAGYLLGRDGDRPQWRTSSDRPPSEGSDFTTTYVAIVALQAYGTEQDRQRIDDRLAKARQWLESTKGTTTEDQVFRLFGLNALSASPAVIREAVAELKGAQRGDGGWSQLPGASSDAYATGSVLVALQRAGGLATDDPVCDAGRTYLLKTQLPDGSWHVVSRSKPFQTYFESGFPHGADQFISMTASSWATAALALKGAATATRP
jgi:N-acyl-D-amino-acid deacylase